MGGFFELEISRLVEILEKAVEGFSEDSLQEESGFF